MLLTVIKRIFFLSLSSVLSRQNSQISFSIFWNCLHKTSLINLHWPIGPITISLCKWLPLLYIFINVYSRFTWIYLMRQKSEVLDTFKLFKKHAELQLGTKILAFQSGWVESMVPSQAILHLKALVGTRVHIAIKKINWLNASTSMLWKLASHLLHRPKCHCIIEMRLS